MANKAHVGDVIFGGDTGGYGSNSLVELQTVVEIQQATITDLESKLANLEDLLYGIIDDMKQSEIDDSKDKQRKRTNELRDKKAQYDVERALTSANKRSQHLDATIAAYKQFEK